MLPVEAPKLSTSQTHVFNLDLPGAAQDANKNQLHMNFGLYDPWKAAAQPNVADGLAQYSPPNGDIIHWAGESNPSNWNFDDHYDQIPYP